jgi:hypothetical protein
VAWDGRDAYRKLAERAFHLGQRREHVRDESLHRRGKELKTDMRASRSWSQQMKFVNNLSSSNNEDFFSFQKR